MSLADSLEERFDPESDSDSDSDLDLEIDKYKGKVSAKSDTSKEDVEAKKDEIVKRNESVSPVVEDDSSTVKKNKIFAHPVIKHTSIGDIFWAYGYMNQNTIRWPCFVIRNRSVLSQIDYDFMKNYKGDGTHLILFADPYKSFFDMLPENDDFLDHPFDPNSSEHDLLVNQFKNYSKTPFKSKRRKSSKSKPPLTKKLRTLERSFEGALEFATKVFELAQERAQREAKKDEIVKRNESVSPVVEDDSSTVKKNKIFAHPVMKHTSIGDIFWACGYMDQNTIRWPCFVIRNRSVLTRDDYVFLKRLKREGTHLILFADPHKSFFEMLPENDDFLDHPFDPNSAEHDLLVNQFKNYSKTPSKSKRRKSSKSKPPLTKKLRTLERIFEGALEFATKVFELAQERAQREDEMLSRFKETEKKEFDSAINEHTRLQHQS